MCIYILTETFLWRSLPIRGMSPCKLIGAQEYLCLNALTDTTSELNE